MRTALDADPERLDEHERAFVAAIREHGWFRTSVLAEEGHPGFSYSTGFAVTLDRPEILVHSLPNKSAHAILWDVFRDVKGGRLLPLGVPLDDLLGNHRACLFRVDRTHYPEHLGWSRWFYGGDGFDCLQLIWPDRDDRFPWEAGFDESMRQDQPDLTGLGWSRELRGA